MKRLHTLLLMLLSVGFVYQANAQDELDEFLATSVDDGGKVIGGYIAPLMKSLSLGMNQSWYNTAKPHKVAGFDLTFTTSLIYIPDSDLLFDVNSLGLTQIALVDASGNPRSNGNIPTVFGPDTPATFSSTSTLGIPADDFTPPGGIDLEAENYPTALPVPMVQLGFGLPKGTEIKFRFIPTIDLGNDGEFKLFGIGVMHDVKQHIRGIKELPFDLSMLIGYTKLQMDITQSNANQNAHFETTSTTIQALISKKLSVVTFYGSLGYNIAKSNLGLLGPYDISGTTVIDPLDLNFTASGVRATVGTRLKLAVFTLSADYTLQKFKALTVGFGISVR